MLDSLKSLLPGVRVVTLGLLTLSIAHAGEAPPPVQETVVPETKPSVVSGTLSFVADTHFISYGSDVWAAGNNWDDLLFHPSLELGIDLGSGFKLIVGTWWDVNDNAESSIGNRIQEVDVWAGLGYTVGKWSFTALWQAWMYGEETEGIVDFKVAYDTFLHPSLTIHGRYDSGAAAGDTGIVGVLGLSEGFSAGPVTFSFPVNVAFMTDGFQAGDAGFGYVSASANASVPLPFLPGNWTFGAGVTYYYTEPDVIPLNPDDSFFTGSTSLTLTF